MQDEDDPRPKRASLEPVLEFGQTAPVADRSVPSEATPFDAARAPAAPPPSRPLEPRPDLGQTAPASRGPLEPRPDLGQTAAAVPGPAERAVPFNPGAPASAPRRTALEPHPELGGTVTLVDRDPPRQLAFTPHVPAPAPVAAPVAWSPPVVAPPQDEPGFSPAEEAELYVLENTPPTQDEVTQVLRDAGCSDDYVRDLLPFIFDVDERTP